MMNKSKWILTVLIAYAFACKKEYEALPYKPANDGARLNIRQLKQRVKDSSSVFRFGTGDTNLYCTVTADETSGNLYKQVFVRDDNGGAIQVNLLNSGGIYAGDKIRINLNHAVIVSANRMVSLDSIDLEKNIVKLSSGNAVLPVSVTLNSITAQLNPLETASMQSQLVEISNVEFTAAAFGKPFGDVISKSASSYIVKNCSGSEAIVRTSGFANFASRMVPTGNGKLVAVVTQYKNDIQLVIRNYNDVQMNGPLCIPTPTITGKIYHLKDFNDFDLAGGGWTSYTITNSAVKWAVSTFSATPTPFAKISGFSAGANTDSECWLISPSMSISTATNPVLSFYSAAKFNGQPLELMVSTTYTGGVPTTGGWTAITTGYTLSPSSGSYVWTYSGSIPLSSFKSPATRVAFRYKSSTAGATTYELDDIAVKED
jgi:hypothetical protein